MVDMIIKNVTWVSVVVSPSLTFPFLMHRFSNFNLFKMPNLSYFMMTPLSIDYHSVP